MKANKIKTLDDKIEPNEVQYNIEREAVEIYALSTV